MSILNLPTDSLIEFPFEILNITKHVSAPVSPLVCQDNHSWETESKIIIMTKSNLEALHKFVNEIVFYSSDQILWVWCSQVFNCDLEDVLTSIF